MAGVETDKSAGVEYLTAPELSTPRPQSIMRIPRPHNATMLAAVLVVSSSLIAQESAQQREDPCNATESFSQFDFWVDEWTVTTADDRT